MLCRTTLTTLVVLAFASPAFAKKGDRPAADRPAADRPAAAEKPAAAKPAPAKPAPAKAAAKPGARPAARPARPKPPEDAPAEPPLAGWSGVWHTAATVSYSSCPGTEAGQQEAFTLTISADAKTITATEQPEQSLLRKFSGDAELRGKKWILLLRDKEGKNGMDVELDEEGKKLVGTRVVVRNAKKTLCSVVFDLEGVHDEA